MKSEHKDIDSRMGDFMDFCGRHGLKATHQRIHIFRELAQSEEHPDAETIYRRVKRNIPSVSFDTVYRTLRMLEEEGMISRLGFPVERQRFDARKDRHHHFVCTDCGRILDFCDSSLDNLPPPHAAEELGTPKIIEIHVRGICRNCESGTDSASVSQNENIYVSRHKKK